MSRIIEIMHLTRTYHWSKGSLVWIVEDGALGNLAAAGEREENVSHHLSHMDFLGSPAAIHSSRTPISDATQNASPNELMDPDKINERPSDFFM